MPLSTHAVDIFVSMVEAVRQGTPMTPRSAGDKEFFAQDWFIDRLRDAGLEDRFAQGGRNSYPDFVVTAPPEEGYEIKSLAFANGRPARADIDFNSTIPSGRKAGQPVFLAFFLYTGTGVSPRAIHSISLAHADLINADHAVADEHVNVAIRQFGSYADGFIRDRKMYVFPHPITIDPSGLGRERLIVPASWEMDDLRLARVGTIGRTVARDAVDSYTIRLHGRGEADVHRKPYANAGTVLPFDVFEAR